MIEKFGTIFGGIMILAIGFFLRYLFGALFGAGAFIFEIMGKFMRISMFIGISNVLGAVFHFFWSDNIICVVFSTIIGIVSLLKGGWGMEKTGIMQHREVPA